MMDDRTTIRAGIAQLVERQPSKLGVAGSNPVSRSMQRRDEALTPGYTGDALVAQSAEHFLGKEEVTGSIPVEGLSSPPSLLGGEQRDRLSLQV